MLQNYRKVGQSAWSGFYNMIVRVSEASIMCPPPHTHTQSLTVSMTTSLQLYSYSQFPFVLRDQGDKAAEGENSTRLNGG